MLFAIDLLSTVYTAMRTCRRFHLFVGANPLNALAGLILRKLGFVQVSVFWSVDFSPSRFRNPILNHLYHLLENIAVKESDCTWCISDAIVKLFAKKSRRLVKATPGCVPCRPLPLNKIDRQGIVYAGDLAPEKGLETLIQSMSTILRYCPKATLTIVGSGSSINHLRAEATSLGLASKIRFTGHLPTVRDVCRVLRKNAIGVAPYSLTYYEPYAFPGKVIQYMACGLPVVMTEIPELANEVRTNETGIVVGKDSSLVKAIVKLLSDDKTYLRFRKNAIQFAAHYGIEHVYTEALAQTFDAPKTAPNE
jgi:glycosyltransferase involved in cell wall biosynthesis